MDDEMSKFYEECKEVEEIQPQSESITPNATETDSDQKLENKQSPIEGSLSERKAEDKGGGIETSQSDQKTGDQEDVVETSLSDQKAGDNKGVAETSKSDQKAGDTEGVVETSKSDQKGGDQQGVVGTSKSDQKVSDQPAEETSKSDQKTGDKEGATANTRYEGSEYIYTNPETKKEFVWSNEMNQWVPRGYKPVFDGKDYIYKDPEGVLHKWNQVTSAWEESLDSPDENSEPTPKPVYGFDGTNHTYTDPKDNTVYLWDDEKKAWFPKVDDDFMARYQMSYGFVDNTTKGDEKPEDKPELKRKAPSTPAWFDMDDERNTKVYVSNLPLDISEQEFVDFMQKCGLVLKDVKTNKFKIKLYREPDGTLKGDALCDYIKVESVALALNVLDGADFKGKRISVQRAKFQMRGDYNPSLKPKKKRKKEKEKEKKIQEKLLDWRPDKLRGEREKHERTVVLKNVFSPATFDEKVELILEYTEDIRTEATKCGVVRKVVLYDKHPEGVATVTFSDAEEADICVKFFNNRWFGQRKIAAETWDGKTKYKVAESEVDNKQRIDKWNKFLETGEKAQEDAEKT